MTDKFVTNLDVCHIYNFVVIKLHSFFCEK